MSYNSGDKQWNLYDGPLFDAVEACNLLETARLLDSGARVNATCGGNYTPLHFAAMSDFVPMIDLLLKQGADPHAKTIRNQTPLDLAKMNNRIDAIQRLNPVNGTPVAVRKPLAFKPRVPGA
jgi:ankyrin repeat protein